MLNVYLSTSRDRNLNDLLKKVCSRESKGDSQQYIIVPEQISHMLERKLCEYGGDSISRYAEILGFSRLAVRVFSEYGGIADTETDAAGKLLTMSLTVEQLRSRLKLYGSKALKPSFLLQLSQTLDELRSSCIGAHTLREKISSVGGSFAVKLEELALLLEGYDSICANLDQNPESRLSRLLFMLEQSDFAAGKSFYFYGFTDFNGVESEIIQQLFTDGADVNIYLMCDELKSQKQQFSTASETARDLISRARKIQIPYEIRVLQQETFQTAFDFLRQHLFDSEKLFNEEVTPVSFISASDPTTECRIVAGEILRLIEQGVRYRDITVACADYESYKGMMQTVFCRAKIPSYFSGDSDILRQPVVHMLLSALEVTLSFEQEAVINYMKAGFTGLSFEQTDKLENYILLWDINGSRFEESWTMSTKGFLNENETLKAARLHELNQSKRFLLQPLVKLRSRFNSAKNTGEMILALNSFMEDIRLNEKLNHMALRLSEDNEKQKAQEYAQVYSIICRLMEQMYGVLGNTVRSIEDFILLFKTAVSLYTVGTIPATIDCVNVGNLSSQRNCETPYLFIVGANEGAFPSVQGNQTLLSDRERELMIRLDIHISPNTIAVGRLKRELAMMDSVLAAPVKKIFISALQSKCSYLYLRGKMLFPNAQCLDQDDALLCRSEWDHNARFQTAEPYAIAPLSQEAVEKLYGQTLQLSSSKIEMLASCRFAYFLQYGLRAQERQSAEVDASLYGTFVHDVLERTSKQVMEEGGFHQVTMERVIQIADRYMERFAQEELADLWHSERAEYLFRRNFNELRCVVKQLYEELSVSEFQPEYFELNFSQREDADLGPIPIEGQYIRGLLEGKVDRVDLWYSGTQQFFRVVDYKTGHTNFDYTKVYYGLGMQMLIYLFALKKYGGQLREETLTPSGVLYFPARASRVSIQDKYDEASLNKEREREEKRSGLLLDHPSVLEAMDPSDSLHYLPCKRNKDGVIKGDLASEEQFALLEQHVFDKVADLTDQLYSGDLEPNPYYIDSNHHGCAWCPFKSICGSKTNKRILEKISRSDFWERLKEEVKHG